MQCILYKIYFFESFSYVLQIDMHFICTPMWTKFYSCKKWVLHVVSVDAWDLCTISFMDVVVLLNVSFMDAVNDSIMSIISLNCLQVTKSSSSSSGSYCGGCFLGGMVSGIEKCSNRWLGISKEEPKVGGITHSLKCLTPLLRVFYLCCRWQPVVVKVTRRVWGDYKVNLCCSREGVAWKVKYGG
jgi:hypothetical protein